VPIDLAFAIERYAELLEYLPTDEETEEVMYTLGYRDYVHDFLTQGEQPTPEHARLLREADERLLAMRDRLVRRFPWVFARDDLPPERWWWRLHRAAAPEGAQALTHG
jgi:hypothetical protein